MKNQEQEGKSIIMLILDLCLFIVLALATLPFIVFRAFF